MRTLAVAFSLSILLLLAGLTTASVARAQPGCTFILGFFTLHNLIPDQVGQCLADETHNPQNGDGLQQTTGGLLVWRKSDNWTAFTDGNQTWVNGPFGLQNRFNNQRFFWEQNPQGLQIIPTPVAGQQCHTAGLGLSLTGTDVGAGNLVGTFQFTNLTNVSCTMNGFIGAQLLDSFSNPLPTNVVRNGPPFTNQPGPSVVTIPAGGTATFLMHWEQIPVGNETSCPASAQIAVTPPNEFDPLIIPATIRACNAGELDVTPVRP